MLAISISSLCWLGLLGIIFGTFYIPLNSFICKTCDGGLIDNKLKWYISIVFYGLCFGYLAFVFVLCMKSINNIGYLFPSALLIAFHGTSLVSAYNVSVETRIKRELEYHRKMARILVFSSLMYSGIYCWYIAMELDAML